MAVAILDTVLVSTATSSLAHLNYPISAESNRVLVAFHFQEGSSGNFTMTYGGQEMTLIAENSKGAASTFIRVRAYVALETDISAASGSIIAAAGSATGTFCGIMAGSFSGANQSAIDVFVIGTATATNPIVTSIAATANSAVIALWAANNVGSPTTSDVNWAASLAQQLNRTAGGQVFGSYAHAIIATASTVPVVPTSAGTPSAGQIVIALNLEPPDFVSSNTPIVAAQASYLKVGTGGRFDRDILT